MIFKRKLLATLLIAGLFGQAVLVDTAWAGTLQLPQKKASTTAKKPTAKVQAKAIKSTKKQASAKTKARVKRKVAAASTPSKNKFSALVVDADSGRVLYEKNAR